MSSKLPPYVQSVGSLDVPPPYQFPGVKVHAFIWETEMAPIQAYCDTVLNLPGDDAKSLKDADAKRGFVYQPAASWPYALLLFLDYPEMISTCQPIDGEVPYEDRGIISQREVFVAVPILRTGATAKAWFSETVLEWALPFIVVDNPMSAVCGREMIGLEKLLASIEMGEGETRGSFKGEVKLPGWETLTPGELQKPSLEFLNVTTAPVLPTFRGSVPQTSLWTLLQNRPASMLLNTLAAAGQFANAAALGLLPLAMRVVTLRQFRDALDPATVVYQSLVTTRSTYSNITDLRFYNENDVKIEFHDSGSFAEIIRVFLEVKVNGVPTSKPTGAHYCVEKIRAAFSFKADIEFDDMRTIHTFPVERAHGLAPVKQESHLASNWADALAGFFGAKTS